MSFVSVVEVLWTVICALGVLSVLRNFRAAVDELEALVEAGLNGTRRIVAGGNVRRERTRLGKLVIFFLIGVTSLLRANDRSTTYGVVVGFALAGTIAIGEMLDSYLDARERRAVFEYEERHPRLERGDLG